MTPAILRWRTDDGQHPMVVVWQAGRDLPVGSRDCTLSVDADGAWRLTGASRCDDRRIGPCCVPSWVVTGQASSSSSWADVMESLHAQVSTWIAIGLRPFGAVDVDRELVDWHQPVRP